MTKINQVQMKNFTQNNKCKLLNKNKLKIKD